jgi:hypothetical protein
LNVHGVSDVRQAEIHTAEPLVPEPSVLEFQLAIEKRKSNKLPGNVQRTEELITAEGRPIRCKKWKESIKVPVYKKGDKSDCNNYSGISLLPTTHKTFSNILLSRSHPHAEKIIVDYQGGFRRNRSTADHVFRIRQIHEKKWGIQ